MFRGRPCPRSEGGRDRRAVVLVGPSTALFVRPTAWGIIRGSVRIAFFPRTRRNFCVIHLVGFDLWIRAPILWRFARKSDSLSPTGCLLNAMAPLKHQRVSQVHLIGQPFGRQSLRESAKKHYDRRWIVVRFRPHRVGEDVEHRSTLPTPIVYDWGPTAIMRCLIGRKLMAVWAGKPLRMKRPLQVLIAFLLTEKLIDGKPDHGNTWRRISWNTSFWPWNRPFWPLQKHVSRIVQPRANMSQDIYSRTSHFCSDAGAGSLYNRTLLCFGMPIGATPRCPQVSEAPSSALIFAPSQRSVRPHPTNADQGLTTMSPQAI